jgi:hypothetical protein
MNTAGENERGIHARMLLESRHDFAAVQISRATLERKRDASKLKTPTATKVAVPEVGKRRPAGNVVAPITAVRK